MSWGRTSEQNGRLWDASVNYQVVKSDGLGNGSQINLLFYTLEKTCTQMLGGCLDIYMRFEVVRLVRLGRHYRIYVKSNFQDFPGARNLTYVVVFASEIEVLVSPNPV